MVCESNKLGVPFLPSTPTRPLATQAGRELKSFEGVFEGKLFQKFSSSYSSFHSKKVFLKKHFRRKCVNFFEFFRDFKTHNYNLHTQLVVCESNKQGCVVCKPVMEVALATVVRENLFALQSTGCRNPPLSMKQNPIYRELLD